MRRPGVPVACSWLFAMGVVCVTGCATPRAASTAPTVDVTGVWTGTRQATHAAGPGPLALSLDLRQSGATVRGTARWGPFPSERDGTGGPLEGRVSGATLTFAVPSQDVTGEAVVDGIEMHGILTGPYFHWLAERYEIHLRRQN